jgi:hypothetical protein
VSGEPNKPPGANSRHASRGRSEVLWVAAVAQAGRWLPSDERGTT